MNDRLSYIILYRYGRYNNNNNNNIKSYNNMVSYPMRIATAEPGWCSTTFSSCRSAFFSFFSNDLHAPQLASHLKHTRPYNHTLILLARACTRTHIYTHCICTCTRTHVDLALVDRYTQIVRTRDRNRKKYVKCVRHMCRARLTHVCIGWWLFIHTRVLFSYNTKTVRHIIMTIEFVYKHENPSTF